MKRTRFIAIGACSIDTILTVPHFPAEDEKLRATTFVRRRGGNAPNTLEVLQQLLHFDLSQTGSTGKVGDETNIKSDTSRNAEEQGATSSVLPVELYLIAVLPAQTSRDVDFITKSFEQSTLPSERLDGPTTLSSHPFPKVNLSHCVYRENFTESVSSYIIASESTSSRTIVNHNAIPEMTRNELAQIVRDNILTDLDNVERLWFHFEGRETDTTLWCMRYLRTRLQKVGLEVVISVELEKPGRPGLQDLAHEADVIFYSRAWAEAEGYESGEMCLREQAKMITSSSGFEKIMICTWGALGACGVVLPTAATSMPMNGDIDSRLNIIHSLAYITSDKQVIDTTGAGDTFIAGVLFGLMCKCDVQHFKTSTSSSDDGIWTMDQILDFANGLAGRKILQQGFRFDFLAELFG